MASVGMTDFEKAFHCACLMQLFLVCIHFPMCACCRIHNFFVYGVKTRNSTAHSCALHIDICWIMNSWTIFGMI